MKYLPFLLLLFIALVSSCSSDNGGSSFADIQEGAITGDTYENQSLGMKMKIPLGWAVKPAPAGDAAPGASELAQRLKRKKRLFFICKDANNCNSSLLGVVQDTSYTKGANTIDKYYDYLVKQDEEMHQKYKVKGHFKRGTEKIGGKEFTTLSLKRENKGGDMQAFEKLIFFRIDGAKLLQINLHSESPQDKDVLMKSIKSITFEE